MVYVCSDLHGFPLKSFRKLLRKVGVTQEDTICILGDVIDRNGDGGVEMLRWIVKQKNVKMIMGNHERMLLDCKGVFDRSRGLRLQEILDLDNYLYNGGAATIENLEMLKNKNPAEFDRIVEYLENLPYYAEVKAGGKSFVLVHGGFDGFSSHRKLSSYDEYDLLWSRPDINTKYYATKTVVLGHTPTYFYGKDCKGRILKTDTWINIDTGAAYGEAPALLRLDDLKEIYFNKENYNERI